MKKIGILGASGHVGEALVTELIQRHSDQWESLTLFSRTRPKFLKGLSGVEWKSVDLKQSDGLEESFEAFDCLYYLVHSIGEKGDFEENEAICAKNALSAAEKNKVKKIVYLGGLCHGPVEDLSKHMRSRVAVGEILKSGSIQCVELRASIVIGAGSLSFDLIRSLVERLPVLFVPKWAKVKSQPIFLGDLVKFLVETGRREFEQSKILEIGGPEVCSYGDLLHIYAEIRQLVRPEVKLPIVTAEFSAKWLDLIAPEHASVGKKLLESVYGDSIVEDPSEMRKLGIETLNVRESMRMALDLEGEQLGKISWGEEFFENPNRPVWGGLKKGARVVEALSHEVALPINLVFWHFEQFGKDHGWLTGKTGGEKYSTVDRMLKRLEGILPNKVDIKNWLGCWKIESIQDAKTIQLKFRYPSPGDLSLKYEFDSDGDKTRITQSLIFAPKGISGLIFWYGLFGVNRQIFKLLLSELTGQLEAPELSQEQQDA